MPSRFPQPRQHALECVIEYQEAEPEQQRIEHDADDRVMQYVVAYLVTQDRLDFGQRSAIQKIVIQADLRGAEQAADIGAHALGLFGLIERLDVIDRNLVGAR